MKYFVQSILKKTLEFSMEKLEAPCSKNKFMCSKVFAKRHGLPKLKTQKEFLIFVQNNTEEI